MPPLLPNSIKLYQIFILGQDLEGAVSGIWVPHSVLILQMFGPAFAE
jgi:hypothetical protein